MEQKTYKFVTHNSRFHTDDVFACAVLSLVLKKQGATYTVTRTRDPQIIEAGDFVFDIGGIHDPASKRFDHHQKGGAGVRDNGVPYAACGLVWREYGEFLSGSALIAQKIDAKLFQPIDSEDNGVSVYTQIGDVAPFSIQNLIGVFRTTWKEDESLMDVKFLELVALAEKIIEREIVWARDVQEAYGIVMEAYEKASDKRVIVFETSVPAEEVLMQFPEPLFVVRPNTDGNWRITGISAKPHSFEIRKQLPQAWAGLRDQELAQVTGISDAVFCHNGLFLAVAKSREGVLALAKIALESDAE